jgi:glycosyltransferase involved in cell wall biosynthesis
MMDHASGAAIAVIVPCHNAECTLEATLESVLVQEGVELEVVVIDDGSKDGSLELARRYEPRIRVLTGPNRGASAARNTGIEETRAPFIVFLDADDLLEPGTLAKRLAVAVDTSADVVITDWLEIIDEGSKQLPTGAHRIVDWTALASDAELATAVHVWATTAAILYRRTIVDKIGGFRADLPIIQDARYLFDAAHNGAHFFHAAHVGARYRVMPGSLSRRNPERFWQDVLQNGQQIETLWAAKGLLHEERRAALLGVYNNAARGLFAVAHPHYFEAVAALRSLGMPQPLHSRVAEPLGRLLGLRVTRSVLSLVQRT